MKACPVCCGNKINGTDHLGEYELCVCDDCGIRFYVNTQESPVDYNEIYHTDEYVDTHLNSLINTKDWSDFAKYPTYQPFFENHTPAEGALLDVGCGVGRFCRAAHSMGWDVRGIDVSQTAIETGKQGVPFSLDAMTIDEMVMSGEKFDVITSFEVLEHLNEPIEFIQKIKKALNPGGKFFCTVPNIDSPSVRSTTRKDWLPPIHVLFFNRNSLKTLLSEAGLKSVEVGEIWVNKPPRGGWSFIKHLIKRMLGRVGRPEPLGIWAKGEL